jgi:hypothetical protein
LVALAHATPGATQAAGDAALERLQERQIRRERLALEGAAHTYRKIGARVAGWRIHVCQGTRAEMRASFLASQPAKPRRAVKAGSFLPPSSC